MATSRGYGQDTLSVRRLPTSMLCSGALYLRLAGTIIPNSTRLERFVGEVKWVGKKDDYDGPH